MSNEQLKVYDVWDKPTRWFHWINVLALLGLIGLGLVILNANALGIATQGKILLKESHVWVGYVFVCNLVFRLFWGFFGVGVNKGGSLQSRCHGSFLLGLWCVCFRRASRLAALRSTP